MKTPLLSIVLITKRDPSLTFKQALESALAQKYKERELLVVNANEPNDPYNQSLLEDLAAYEGVKLLQPGDTGAEAFYRNLALEQAQGKYIAFMSGKDEWFPHKASLQVEQLELDADAVASCANGISIYSQPKQLTRAAFFTDAPSTMEQLLMNRAVRNASQVVYKTDLLRQKDGFDNRFRALVDLDQLLDFWGTHRILFLISPLFTTKEESDRESLLCCLGDRRALMVKHSSIFFANPKFAFNYCTQMGRHALARKLWASALAYYLLALFYAPFRVVLRGVRGFWRSTRHWLRFAALQAEALFSAYRLKARVCKTKQSSRQWEDPADSKSLKKTPQADEPVLSAEAKIFASYAPFTFAKQKGLATVVIPKWVNVIKRGMFFANPDLETVVIPATVSRIEPHAFQDCCRLSEVRFLPGSTLASICSYAFAGCHSLERISLPGSLRYLGKGAFAGCENLRQFVFDGDSFPNAIWVLPPYVFAGCSALAKVVFKDGSVLEHVGKGAFFNCHSLETLSLAGAIKSIGSFAFFGCKNLEGYGMPLIDAVGSIGRSAFEGCSRLKDIQVPRALKKINRRTYYGCREVKKVIIPKGVRLIRSQAFAQCSSLLEVTLMNELTFFRPSAFPQKVTIVINKPKGIDN